MKKQGSGVRGQDSAFIKHLSCSAYRVSCVLGMLLLFSLFTTAHAKIYIDISSPGARQLPITIITTGPMKSKEIEWIVKSDLEATGIFEIVDPDVPGAEIIAVLDVDMSGGLKVVLSVKDMIENREVLKKRFDASKVIIRPMAHSIANDIYKVVTGKDGVFRTKISYLKELASGKKELRYMDWDGYNSRKIISRGLTTSHNWSQDGRYLFYSSERKRKWKIYFLDLDNFRESLLFSSKGLNIVGGTSPDGLVSFSSSKDGSSEIYTINKYGKKLKKLTRSFGIDVSPVFSPNGEKIAFVSDRGGTPQIYVITSQGKNLHRVTFEGTYNTSPAWSFDGESIAYTGRSNGKFQIFVVQSDGTDLRQLTVSGNNESPSFSPDGIFLVFDSDRDGKRGIYVMRSNGEGQKKITDKHVKAMTPEWSPYLKK
jgi:TolB protein